MRCWGANDYGQVMLVTAFLLEGCGVCLGGSFFLADAMCV